MRGSILPRIALKLAIVGVLSTVVVLVGREGWVRIIPIAPLPFSLIGIALSIFAGFRNSACYDRWWEGRKIWGQIAVDVRSLTRQALIYGAHGDAALARAFAHRAIAFVHALRDRLRDEPLGDAACQHLSPPEATRLRTARNAPNLILRALSADIGVWLAQGRVSPQIAQLMEERVVSLSAGLAASERLKGAPVPFAYSLLLHRTVYLFCLLLPFGLVEAAGAWTPLMVLVVSYTFFGLDALGDELEKPFSRSENGLPLDAMAQMAGIVVLEMIDDPDLPPDPVPKRFVLL